VRPGLKEAVVVDAIVDKVQAFDSLLIPVHAYLPKQRAGKQLPVIVSVHGGPSSSSMAGWNPAGNFFASQGYAWVEPNIRGSTGFGRGYEMADNKEKRGDALKDLESVNAWVKAQPWADKDRVVIFGGSYGGYIVLMALTRQVPLWRAGVDLVGVSSLPTLMKNTSGVIRAVLTDEFGDLDTERDLLEAWSPLKDADKITAPLLVYQGQNDPRVPRSESDQIVRALRARKVPVEYMIAMNEGHSIDRRETRVELYARMARFLGDQLKK
jgi:dipeptidyl aminopeptidase/acylaminoacyl peptidase